MGKLFEATLLIDSYMFNEVLSRYNILFYGPL